MIDKFDIVYPLCRDCKWRTGWINMKCSKPMFTSKVDGKPIHLCQFIRLRHEGYVTCGQEGKYWEKKS